MAKISDATNRILNQCYAALILFLCGEQKKKDVQRRGEEKNKFFFL